VTSGEPRIPEGLARPAAHVRPLLARRSTAGAGQADPRVQRAQQHLPRPPTLRWSSVAAAGELTVPWAARPPCRSGMAADRSASAARAAGLGSAATRRAAGSRHAVIRLRGGGRLSAVSMNGQPPDAGRGAGKSSADPSVPAALAPSSVRFHARRQDLEQAVAKARQLRPRPLPAPRFTLVGSPSGGSPSPKRTPGPHDAAVQVLARDCPGPEDSGAARLLGAGLERVTSAAPPPRSGCLAVTSRPWRQGKHQRGHVSRHCPFAGAPSPGRHPNANRHGRSVLLISRSPFLFTTRTLWERYDKTRAVQAESRSPCPVPVGGRGAAESAGGRVPCLRLVSCVDVSNRPAWMRVAHPWPTALQFADIKGGHVVQQHAEG